MEKRTKALLAIVLVLLTLNLALTFFGKSAGLKQAIRSLEATRDSIRSAISEIEGTRGRINAIDSSLQQLKRAALRSGVEVRLINQQLRLKNEKSRAIVDSLQKEIQKNLQKLNDL